MSISTAPYRRKCGMEKASPLHEKHLCMAVCQKENTEEMRATSPGGGGRLHSPSTASLAEGQAKSLLNHPKQIILLSWHDTRQPLISLFSGWTMAPHCAWRSLQLPCRLGREACGEATRRSVSEKEEEEETWNSTILSFLLPWHLSLLNHACAMQLSSLSLGDVYTLYDACLPPAMCGHATLQFPCLSPVSLNVFSLNSNKWHTPSSCSFSFFKTGRRKEKGGHGRTPFSGLRQ